MKRTIFNPIEYDANDIDVVAPNTPWDFNTDRDMKVGGELNGTAQAEATLSNFSRDQTAIAAGYGTNFCQKYTEPGHDNNVWHVTISAAVNFSANGMMVMPYCTRNNTSSARS